MPSDEKGLSKRILVLVTTPKSAKKAEELFRKGGIPIGYRVRVKGTVSSDMMDILGLGSIDKRMFISPIPKMFADEMLYKLKSELKLGTINSGIAFTVPLSGASSLIMQMLNRFGEDVLQTFEREVKTTMSDIKYTLIAAVINQGYSDEVMKAAKSAGATGGSVIHGRRIGSEEMMNFWGFGVQEEKEIVMIVADSQNKLKIMQSISENCGVRTDAKGIVMSLPLDNVVGLS